MIQPSKAPKQDYEQWITTAMEIVHGRETRDAFLNVLKTPTAGQQNGKGQVEALADACVMVVQKIDQASRQQKVEVEDAVKVIGASEIIKQIYEVGEASGLLRLDQDHQDLALSYAIQEYVGTEIKAGRIDPDRLKAHMQKGMNSLPPEEKQKMQESMARITEVGKRYSGGQ